MRWLLILALAGCAEETSGLDFAGVDLMGSLSADFAMPPKEMGPPDLSTPPVPVVYVSGYSPQIARFAFNSSTGALTSMGTTSVSGSPSFLAVDPARRHLYALDEANAGLVRAFSIDGQSGALSMLGATLSSGGNGPAHLSVDPLGKWVLAANYGDGKVSVLSLNNDGSLGVISETRIAGDQAHQILADETSTHVFVPCKQANYIAQYTFAAGKLTPNGPATVAASMAGAGPRHMVLSPGFAYVIEENASRMVAYTRDSAGRLLFLQQLSTVPGNFTGTNTGAEAVLAGNYLYGSNRGHDSIVQYSLGSDGRMTTVGFTKTGGATPRSFTVDPTGRWLLVANQDSDEVRVMSLDPATGVPTLTSVVVSVPNPAFVGLVLLPGT